MQKKLGIKQFCSLISHPNADNIANLVKKLIASGEIKIGDILPSVTEWMTELNVNSAMINRAWSILRKQKIIANSAFGIVVISDTPPLSSIRFSSLNLYNQAINIDLSSIMADPDLLPDIYPAVAQAADVADLHSYQLEPIVTDLYQAVVTNWPYPTTDFIAVNSSFEGLALLFEQLISTQAIIAVETPFSLGIADFLKQFYAQIIPVSCDDQGPNLTSLKHALSKKPLAFIYQPAIHSPCGHSVTARRLASMAKLFAESGTLIIEVDLMGDLKPAVGLSMGGHLPQQTIYNRSYIRSYGVDVNLSVLSVPKCLMNTILKKRNNRSGSASRLLQQTLAFLITQPQIKMQLDKAIEIYHNRQKQLLKFLKKKGFTIAANQNLGLWLPVHSEQYALALLSAKGIQVMGGSLFNNGKKTPYIQVATNQLKENKIEYVADALAEVIKPSGLK